MAKGFNRPPGGGASGDRFQQGDAPGVHGHLVWDGRVRWFQPRPFTAKDIDIVVVANFGQFKRHHALFQALREWPASLRALHQRRVGDEVVVADHLDAMADGAREGHAGLGQVSAGVGDGRRRALRRPGGDGP